MKTLRRSIALTLSIIMLLSVTVTVHAADYTPKYTAEAETLYELGLFKGTGTNADGTPIFSLEQKATRIQGLVMLIRLMGKEAEVRAYTGKSPFTDVPAWAECYAAYAYDNGITKGTSATTFGSDDALLGKAYITFVLRALGYDDAAGDFSYNEALAKGAELGLIGVGECVGDIYRDDCAVISYRAIKTKMKGTDTILLDKLISDGALTDEMVQNSGLLEETVYIPFGVEKQKIDFSDVKSAIPNAHAMVMKGTGNGDITSAGAQPVFTVDRLFVNLVKDDIAAGKTPPAMKATTETTSFYLYHQGYTLLTVVSEDYHIIGYAAIRSGYTEDTVPFKLCNYGGPEGIERLKKEAKAVSQLQKIDENAISFDKIVSFTNGVKTDSTRLSLKGANMPDSVADPAYYSLVSIKKGVEYGWLEAEYSFMKESPVKPVLKKNGENNLIAGVSGKYALFVYDENKETIAYSIVTKAEFPVAEYASFEDGARYLCTISANDANALMKEIASTFEQSKYYDDKADEATKTKWESNLKIVDKSSLRSDYYVDLHQYIYLYRTERCTKDELVENVYRWIAGVK